jgi:hypothetical protein
MVYAGVERPSLRNSSVDIESALEHIEAAAWSSPPLAASSRSG